MKENILFLDYDGVINIDHDNFSGYLDNPEAIYFINKLCLENNFKIVVTSAWKSNPKYVNVLHEAGLSKDIDILGCTKTSFKGREFEIKEFLEEHKNINKYLIIDDANFSKDFEDHLVQTIYKFGFTKSKYEEAIKKINSL